MLIGTNNSDDRNFKKTHTPEEIHRGTKAIVNLIKKNFPEIKILVLRIFPRGGDDEKGARHLGDLDGDEDGERRR